MKYVRKLVDRIQNDVWINKHYFSVQKEKLIFKNSYLVCQQDFKKKERSIGIAKASKLIFPWISWCKMFSVCYMWEEGWEGGRTEDSWLSLLCLVLLLVVSLLNKVHRVPGVLKYLSAQVRFECLSSWASKWVSEYRLCKHLG